MKMITMRLRQVGNDHRTRLLRRLAVIRQPRQLLQQGQRLQLQRIEVERVLLQRHGDRPVPA
jgi:hypothetical protein